MQSAYQKMISFNKSHDDTKRIYQGMQETYLYHKFKDGVFCPSSEIYTIAPSFMVELARGTMSKTVVSHLDKRQLALLQYFWGLHLFGTWRNTLGLYRFDPDVLKDVIKSSIPSDTPSVIFERLPDWCVYIELPEGMVSKTLANGRNIDCDGFWALLDYDFEKVTQNQRLVLNVVLDVTNETQTIYDTLQPIRILLDEKLTVYEAYEQLFDADFSMPNQRSNMMVLIERQKTRELLMTLLSTLLWLCAEEPDISNIKGEPLSREDIKKSGLQVNKKTGRFVPPSMPVVRELGKRLGGEIRYYKQQIEADDKQPSTIVRRVRPHIRRGHFHGFWKGSGQNKQFDVRWLPATFVNSSI